MLAILCELVDPDEFDKHPQDFVEPWHRARAIISRAQGVYTREQKDRIDMKNKFDQKAYGQVRKAKDDTVIPESTWMLFVLKDDAFPATLRFYRSECVRLGADAEQIAAVDRAIIEMDEWRAANPDLCKIPDAAGERLIG